MASKSTVFACTQCGHESAKWHGRCPGCEEWNTLVEERIAPAQAGPRGGGGGGGGSSRRAKALKPVRLADVEAPAVKRMVTGIGEFDRVLGGGIVPGSLVLIGGAPGIGKSTLLLQAAAHFARTLGPVLYASGEESEHQIKSRGDRLGVGTTPLYLL